MRIENGVFETTKVLITVMTYPHPSRAYQELVCTAGVTESGEWVRLYPIDYRYLPAHQRFHKYQWIELGLAARGKGNDNRKESRKPDLNSIRVIGKPLSRNNNWEERRRIIDQLPVYTRRELESLYVSERVSLGVVQPIEVLDIEVEPAEREWKAEWQSLLDQFNLFGTPPKRLEKIPYKFSYVFRCLDSDSPHRAMIEDWELGVRFLNARACQASERLAADDVRSAYMKMCGTDKDTKFFMGTTWPYNAWVVIGVYYPPKLSQATLFN